MTAVKESKRSEGHPKLTLRQILDPIKDQHPLADVLADAGIRLRRSGAAYLVACCPFHKESSPSFKIRRSDPNRFQCYGCNTRGDVFTFLQLFYNLATLNDQVLYLTGQTLRELSEGMAPADVERVAREWDDKKRERVERQKKEEEETAPVGDEMAGPVYEALLDYLDLSDEDSEGVIRRGIQPNVAYSLGYRTLPVNRGRRIEICQHLIDEGFRLDHVPGFFQLPDYVGASAGRWCFAGTAAGWRGIRDRQRSLTIPVKGMLIPTRNEAGQIVRLKVRNESAPRSLPTHLRERWPEKYLVLSSAYYKGGANAGVRLHHTGPRDGGSYPGTLWTTEGEIKADLSALRLNARFTGLPGVTQCPELVIQAALDGGFRKLYIAMDREADLGKRKTVAYATEGLSRHACKVGLDPHVVLWEAGQGKGIDDMLYNNGRWSVLSQNEWWEQLSPDERQYAIERLEDNDTTPL